MPRSSPTTLSLPPFQGAVRDLILANTAAFFALLVLQWLTPVLHARLIGELWLQPTALATGHLWQVFTYLFIHLRMLDILFAMMTLWFCGSLLEAAYGRRWLLELYFSSAVGGGILVSAISFTQILHLSPDAPVMGAWGGLFGVLIAIAVRMGDQEFLLFPLPISIRAKYMVAINILIALAIVLSNQGASGALLELSGALCGYLYLRYAPRRGMAFGFSEQYYGLRNSFYRYKRRKAARKFEVYMGKQGRKVKFDSEGRYIDPDELKKDPNDKRWMN